MSALPDWMGLAVTAAGFIITLGSFQNGRVNRLQNRLGSVIFFGGFVLGTWLDQQQERQELIQRLDLLARLEGPAKAVLQADIAEDVQRLAGPLESTWWVLFGIAVGLFAVELARVKPWPWRRQAVPA